MIRNVIVPMAKLAAIAFVAKKLLEITSRSRATTSYRTIADDAEKPSKPTRLANARDRVDVAIEESFPASDPPSWSPTIAGQC